MTLKEKLYEIITIPIRKINNFREYLEEGRKYQEQRGKSFRDMIEQYLKEQPTHSNQITIETTGSKLLQRLRELN